MTRYNNAKQRPIGEVKIPFVVKLSKENRWVKLAEVLPCDKLAEMYIRTFSTEKKGRLVKVHAW